MHYANSVFAFQKKWEIHPEVLPPANQMSWAMHLLGELRRNRRTKLKQKLYTEGATKEEVLAKIPAWAEPQQFADLVDYWFDPKTEVQPFSCSIIFYLKYSYHGVFEFTEYSLCN